MLTQDPTDAERYGDCVVQLYVDRPFLIDGYKFDLRVYALVLSVDPLKIFMYKEGLVRICTEKYKAPSSLNIKTDCMHLTNYSVNKKSDCFEYDPNNFSVGSKRDFNFLNKYLESQGHSPDKVWDSIADIIIKTVLTIYPQLLHQYRTSLTPKHGDFVCFEILGFDILLDETIKPWLLEVNHSPSFNTDTPLDKHVKLNLLTETMKMLAINPNERIIGMKIEKAMSRERITGHYSNDVEKIVENMPSREEIIATHTRIEDEVMSKGKYKRIYPTSTTTALYSKFIEKASQEFTSAQSHFMTSSALNKQVSLSNVSNNINSNHPHSRITHDRSKSASEVEGRGRARSNSSSSTRASDKQQIRGTTKLPLIRAKSGSKIPPKSASEQSSRWLEKRKSAQNRPSYKISTKTLNFPSVFDQVFFPEDRCDETEHNHLIDEEEAKVLELLAESNNLRKKFQILTSVNKHWSP